MDLIFRTRAIISYYFRGRTRYDVHSPFLNALIKQVIENSSIPKTDYKIAPWLNQLKHDNTTVQTSDFGAGSSMDQKKTATVSSTFTRSSSSTTDRRLLYHLSRFAKPKAILELGSCLGVSGAYLQSGHAASKLVTIEGNPMLAEKASIFLQSVCDTEPVILIGKFAEKLTEALTMAPSYDLIFIDGHHDGTPLLSYFRKIKPHLHRYSFVVIHDINWSKSMQEAWHTLRQIPEVTLSVECFNLGILCFNPDIHEKQNFTWIPYWSKPWRIGLLAPR